MMKRILKCIKCGTYTMKEACFKCENKTVLVRPLKYSPIDRMKDYRRRALTEEYKKRGFI